MSISKKAHILIVDDTSANIDILGALLAGYKRSFALNGEAALKKARSDAKPDLILLDVMMPGMDGFEVCRQLKKGKDTQHIPVIFVTSMGEEHDEKHGFEVGAVDYISKPFNPFIVKSRVETHLELHQARKMLASQNHILEETVAVRTSELEKTLQQLRGSSLEMILRLSRAAEYKDDDTGAHILRMSRYCYAIAKELNLPEEEREMLLSAAPMHDVGKIGIPDKVLLKPGKLDKEEWALMQRHAEMGADILAGSDVPVIQMAQTVAESHHEKWDGSGYPKGLKGEGIPIVGRISAIADVFDALTSERPYKKPFSIEKSFAIIREGRGTHFDPAVVDAFFNVENEILRIKEECQEGDGIYELFKLTK